MAKIRRAYKGGAVSTTTSGAIASTDTSSFNIGSYVGWPYGSDPFYVVVEPGTANEEKMLVTRSGQNDSTVSLYSTPTVNANRGLDGTAAVAHASGSTIYPVFTAVDADEANELVAKMTTKGDLLTHGASTFARLAVGTDSHVLVADSAQSSGIKWGQVAADGLASNAVTTAKIVDVNVTTGKLADNAVTTAKITDSNVTTAKIADLNVTTGKIADLGVTTGKLAANAVTAGKLGPSGSNGQLLALNSGAASGLEWVTQEEVLIIPISDETTSITASSSVAKLTFRMPFAMTLTGVKATLTTASSSGLPTFDIKESGTSILSTKITIDANEKTSTTAATAAVISDSSLADDAEITIFVTVAGTGAKGAKIYLIGKRA